MSDEPFSLDFNDAAPEWVIAAKQVQPAALAAFFHALQRANALWDDPTQGQKGSAIAALRAVTSFLASNTANTGGLFSRPLDLLALELKNQGAPDPGNILAPWVEKQTAERGRRDAVNHLKAAAAFVADRLHATAGLPLKSALFETAEVLRRHSFPLADFMAAETTWPTADSLADKIANWRKESKRGQGGVGLFFKSFLKAPPTWARPDAEKLHTRRNALLWLEQELIHAGYEVR